MRISASVGTSRSGRRSARPTNFELEIAERLTTVGSNWLLKHTEYVHAEAPEQAGAVDQPFIRHHQKEERSIRPSI
jgi:hypothetical protein